MRNALLYLPLLIGLGSCSSPPKPPTVDESQRRPVNSAMAVELQVCTSELQNTRILATENARASEVASAATVRVVAHQQPVVAPATEAPNLVYVVQFAFGSTEVTVPEPAATKLIDQARVAPLVLLRGRTDGIADNAADSRIARDRAAAVLDFLVRSGLDPARIRTTHQPVGDYAADNGTPAGRSVNRRVEIEIYRAAPQVMTVAALPATP